MNKIKNEVIIIGAGISGLVLGYYLAREGHKPIIIEKSDRLGGLSGVRRVENFFIEDYYHYFLSRDVYILELLEELNLDSDIIWQKAKIGLFSFGGIKFLGYLSKSGIDTYSSGWDFLNDSNLTVKDKFLLVKLFSNISRLKDLKEIENVSAREWIVKLTSEKIYELIFEPILFAKWGERRLDISASWLVARLGARLDFRKHIKINEYIGYPRGSFGDIFSKLEEKIVNYGGEIIKHAEVVEIVHEGDAGLKEVIFLKEGRKKRIPAKFAVSTLHLPLLTKMLSLPEGTREICNKIEHQKVICACLGLKKQLAGVLNVVCMPNLVSFNGIVEHTSIVPRKLYNNQTIVYLFKYLHGEEKEWHWNDKEIINKWVMELLILFPSFKERDLLWAMVNKDDSNEPVSIMNYSQIMPALTCSIKGLFLTGLSRLPYIQDCNNLIRLVKEDMKEIKDCLG